MERGPSAEDNISMASIIEQMDATTVIPPDFNALVDDFGNLLLKRRAGDR